MKKSIYIVWVIVCCIIINCKQDFSFEVFIDPTWPTVTIERTMRDHSWPADFSALPSTELTIQLDVNHYIEVGCGGKTRTRNSFEKVYFNKYKGTPESNQGLERTFVFIRSFSSPSTTFYFRGTNEDPKCERESALHRISDEAAEQIVQDSLDMCKEVTQHFVTYPDYEEPFPSTLKERIQRAIQNSSSLPSDMQYNCW